MITFAMKLCHVHPMYILKLSRVFHINQTPQFLFFISFSTLSLLFLNISYQPNGQ
ncbi:hypothetical protein GLYMA_19G061700v4 [Glycine max]|uniref:Uncharacterized protein n=1 Tax=Glycine max TaxID=3847 RepID=A0A0R0EIJ5_SOYBN|nr:hypothetical protein GYH30_052210 [Glycine max]KRG94091.1 hypothetical protein GLYMA_19G061700v4 [Glycine max]